MNILVTGAAGFIGSNLCERILKDDPEAVVIGIDNVYDFYDIRIKEWRLNQLPKLGNRFIFIKGNLSNKVLIDEIFS